MILEKAIFTALPDGLDKTKLLRLSVHIAPRLTTDDGDPTPRQLGEYPAFREWAAHVAEMRWHVEFFDGSSTTTAEGIPQSKPDPKLWGRLFPPDTFVRPHAFEDHSKKTFHSFPVREVLQFIESTYASLSAEGPDLPSIDGPNALTQAFGPLAGLTNVINDNKSFWDEVGRAKAALPLSERPDGQVARDNVSGSSGAANALFEAYRFYHRPGDMRPEFDPAFDPKFVEPSPKPPDFDFHEVVALSADHPQVARKLGFVVDLIVQLEDPQAHLAASGAVRVVPDGDLPESPPRTPWTAYDLEGRWFGTKPKDAFNLERGLVRLSREFWDLFQVDVDGAALQAVGMGDVLARLTDPQQRNFETPPETGAPALRSGGFSLARQRRADGLLELLKEHRDLNDDLEQNIDTVLHLEDVLRGYRVDVFDDSGAAGARWYPLHDRITTHVIGLPGAPNPITLEPIRDEGFVKSTAASSERDDHPKPSDDLYLHETVVSWDGWSLAVARPGKRIVEPGEGENGGASPLARYTPGDGQTLPLLSTVAIAPKTLPMLRVGHTYRVRVRTVDVAGNSVPFSEKELAPLESDLASEAQRAVRFEPVPSPTVLRRHLDTEGESLEHLVIRSDGGVSAKDYGAQHSYAEDSQRHLAPPKGSMQMAEFDGKFDTQMRGTAAQVRSALRTALREEGTFLDPKIVNTTSGLKDDDQKTISVHPSGPNGAKLPTTRGSGLSGDEADFEKKIPGAYAYYPDTSVILPYLPDPLAVGIAIVGYDVSGAEVLSHVQAFSGTWPKLAPFRVRLSELVAPEPPAPPTPPTIGFTAGVLEIRLPKAAVIRARLSSVFPDGRLKDLAIWDWTPEADRTPDLEKAAAGGRHWMLTPSRAFMLTHAVQRPLLVPDMTKVTVSRLLGQTFATFDGPIANHARSTGRLDVFGHWTEDVDLITDALPRMARTGTAVVHSGQAFGFDIGPTEDKADVTAVIGTSERLSRHEFADTKHRRVVYHSVATTRFREYLPLAIAADPPSIQREEAWHDAEEAWLEPLVREIPSSARPAIPDVVQTLPSFRWERLDEGPKRTHVRHGKAVRVWLRRPWFSSGDGEQLGVVLEPAVRLAPGWVTPFDVIDQAISGFASASRTPAKAAPSRAGTRATRGTVPGSFMAAPGSAFVAGQASLGAAKQPKKKASLKLPGTLTPEAIHAMLQPYVTRWGSDPVWASKLPELPPIVADFPARISDRTGLTLDEVSPQAKVNVAGHEVYYDPVRELWYSDIEIDNGDSYYPFVRLALARYQPVSVNGAHLSRIVMADFMQLPPDRTAIAELGQGAVQLTVRGYGGENITGRLWSPIFSDILFDPDAAPSPNTEMRAVLQRRPKEIPGDLGWEAAGPEVNLTPDAQGFYVTWTGTIGVAVTNDDADLRILITEIETFPRDMLPSDPPYMVSPRDHLRERVVYADTFDL